jgi:hypothetical protein
LGLISYAGTPAVLVSPTTNRGATKANAVNLGIVAAQCCLSFKSVVAVRVRLMKLV